MLLTTLLIGSALAAPPAFEAPAGMPGQRLPGAADFPAGEWTAEGAGQVLILGRIGFLQGGGRLSYAVTDRFSLSLAGGGLNESSGVGAQGQHGMFSATARYQIAANDTVRLSTWLRPQVYTNLEGHDPLRSSTALGVSIEGGDEHTRLDISLPLVCLDTFEESAVKNGEPDYRRPGLSLHPGCLSSLTEMPEIGVSALLGDGHRIRVAGIYPTISYGYFGETVFAEFGVGLLSANPRLGFRL
jgi:hypothetical protein